MNQAVIRSAGAMTLVSLAIAKQKVRKLWREVRQRWGWGGAASYGTVSKIRR